MTAPTFVLRRVLAAAAALVLVPAALAQPGGGPPGGKPGASGDSVLKFDQRNFQVWEESGEAVVSIERFKGSEGEVSVSYEVVGGTATPGVDYELVSGTVTWGDGDTARKTFSIVLLDDDLFEVFETIELALVEPTNGATLHPGHGQAVVMIKDAREDNPGQVGDLDESPGTLRFVDAELQGVEGDEVEVRVQRVDGRMGAVSVAYATADGSATAGADYASAAGTLSWADGEMGLRSFTVDLLDDDLEEGNETVLLALSTVAGGATLDATRADALLSILDDDGSTAACVEDDETLCLAEGRFAVRVDWRTSQGTSGAGHVDPVSDSTGLVWFFEEGNKEMLIKVIDACVAPFDSYWVFFAATTNVDFTVTVTDTATGLVKEYTNASGDAATPVQDTLTFATCGG